MGLQNFSGDEDMIAYKAFLKIKSDFFQSSGGNIPDFLPFKNTEIFDINKNDYESPVLALIVRAVREVCMGIVQEQYPYHHLSDMNCHSDKLKRISWKIFGLLRLAPLRDRGKNGKTIAQYYQFPLANTYGEEGHIYQTHNRIHDFYERLQETYDTLIKTHNGYLNERYDLLEKFMLAKKTEDYERLLPHLELLSQKIASTRADIIDFSHKNNFLNPFSPPQKKEESQFESAIHWNQHHTDGAHTESFDPSESEQQLAPFLPKDFQVYEWDLYSFEFSDDDSDEYYLEGEIDNFRKKQYERKMLVLYYARMHLALHRRGTLTLSPNLAARMKKNVSTLEQELDTIRRLMMNGGDDEEEQELAHEDGKVLTFDITGVDELCTRAQNIVSKMDLMHTDVRILGIFERLTGSLSTFLTDCINIRTDDALDNTDKADIIATFRQELLRRLELLRGELDQLGLDDTALDAAEEIISLTLEHLSQY